MDIYVLDDSFRPIEVFDSYETLISVERAIPPHEFEMETVLDIRAFTLFRPGVHLWVKGSAFVIQIESRFTTKSEGKTILKVLGRSVEKIFEDRVVAKDLVSSEDADGNPAVYALEKTPTEMILQIANASLSLTPSYDDYPRMSGVNYTEVYGSIPIPPAVKFQIPIAKAIEPMNEIAEIYDLGWRMVLGGQYSTFMTTPFNMSSNLVTLQVYTGDDRTSLQTVNAPVIFSEEFGNLASISNVESIKDVKNVAYVFHKRAVETVAIPGFNPGVVSADRRVLMVDGSDVNDQTEAGTEIPLADLQVLLQRKGLNELLRHRPVVVVEGEADQNSGYVYGVDYFLGDRVEFRDAYGNRSIMVVTEQVLTVDGDGTKHHPTLTYYGTVTPDTWEAYNPTQYWLDVPDAATHEWLDLP